MALSIAHKAFIAEYIKNGYNATQAYLSIRPEVSYETAATNAGRLLKNAEVIEALETRSNRTLNKAIASREHLISEAHDILEAAKQEKQYSTALNAVDLKAKLNKLYDKSEPETEGYIKLINMLQVNVTVQDNPGNQAINITPDDKQTSEDRDKE